MLISAKDAVLTSELVILNQTISSRAEQGYRVAVAWDLSQASVDALISAGFKVEDNKHSASRSRDCFTISW